MNLRAAEQRVAECEALFDAERIVIAECLRRLSNSHAHLQRVEEEYLDAMREIDQLRKTV